MSVRTDQLWRYVRDVQLQHSHGCPCCLRETWSTLIGVEESSVQGWTLVLEDGCELQASTPIEHEVQVNWHEDVLSWGKRVGSPAFLLI
jgi:hypothetical protein